jgi:hypothetical protein
LWRSEKPHAYFSSKKGSARDVSIKEFVFTARQWRQRLTQHKETWRAWDSGSGLWINGSGIRIVIWGLCIRFQNVAEEYGNAQANHCGAQRNHMLVSHQRKVQQEMSPSKSLSSLRDNGGDVLRSIRKRGMRGTQVQGYGSMDRGSELLYGGCVLGSKPLQTNMGTYKPTTVALRETTCLFVIKERFSKRCLHQRVCLHCATMESNACVQHSMPPLVGAHK